MTALIAYSRSGQMSLRSGATPCVSADVLLRVQQLDVRRPRYRRGRRAGRSVQARVCRPVPVLRPAGNGAYTVVTINRPSARTHVYGSDRRNVKVIPTVAHRHVRPDGRFLVFGCMNVRSLSPAKLDDLLVEFRDRSLDVMLLCETWHDVDSVAIRRLRADGFRVVERARLRPHLFAFLVSRPPHSALLHRQALTLLLNRWLACLTGSSILVLKLTISPDPFPRNLPLFLQRTDFMVFIQHVYGSLWR